MVTRIKESLNHAENTTGEAASKKLVHGQHNDSYSRIYDTDGGVLAHLKFSICSLLNKDRSSSSDLKEVILLYQEEAFITIIVQRS